MPPWFHQRLSGSFTVLSEDADGVRAFMTLSPAGCLDFAYAHPRAMVAGLADAIYDGIIEKAQNPRLSRLHAEASHYARRFLTRRGWSIAGAFEETVGDATFEPVEMEFHLAPNAER
jgi:putative acetyltransferase